MDSALKNWAIAILSVCLIAVGIGIYFSEKNEKTPPVEKVVKTPSLRENTTSLSFALQSVSLPKGDTSNLNINIDSPKDTVTAVELNVTFDPKIVTIEDFTPLDFLENPDILLKKIDNKKGLATLAFGSLTPRSGKGILASLKVKGKSSGNINLDLSESQIATSLSSENILKDAGRASVTVK